MKKFIYHHFQFQIGSINSEQKPETRRRCAHRCRKLSDSEMRKYIWKWIRNWDAYNQEGEEYIQIKTIGNIPKIQMFELLETW